MRDPRHFAVRVGIRAGGSRPHDLAVGNLLSAFSLVLRGGDASVCGPRLKVVSPDGVVSRPDLFVRRGPPVGACADPVVVVDVLSPGDLIRTRWSYQTILAVQHLVYVNPDRMKVELATRGEDGRWWSELLTAPEAPLPLAALGVEVTLADIYAGTAAQPG